MRLTSFLTGLLMAGTALAVVPAAAHADTGGETVYLHDARHAYRAPAAHPARRTTLARPATRVRGTLADVQPSPDGRLVAQVWSRDQVKRGVYVTRIVVSDRNGRHARVVWARTDNTDRLGKATKWHVDGVSWGGRARGGVRLYFTAARIDDADTDASTRSSRLMTTVVPPKRGRTATVPVAGGEGLIGPTVDPTTGRLAAVREYDPTCGGGGCTITSTVELLDPRTGSPRVLSTVSTRVLGRSTASPVTDLAWSPDGTQIAFQHSTCCVRPDGPPERLRLGEIGVVAVDGSDGDDYRVAVAYDDRHLVESPTWRGAHSLWFGRGVQDERYGEGAVSTPADLFSVSVRNGRFGPLVQRSRTAFDENAPSFG